MIYQKTSISTNFKLDYEENPTNFATIVRLNEIIYTIIENHQIKTQVLNKLNGHFDDMLLPNFYSQDFWYSYILLIQLYHNI